MPAAIRSGAAVAGVADRGVPGCDRLRQVGVVSRSARRSRLLVIALGHVAGACRACSQRVLAAVAVRLGFLFLAIALAGPGRHHRQARRRPRPAAGRGRRPIPSSTSPSCGAWSMRASRPATPRPRSRPRSRSARCGRAAAAAVDLCRRHRVEPGRRCGAPPERRGGGRRRSGVVGALLVRDWLAARRLGFRPRPTAHAAVAGPVLGADQKGCPQPSPVNKKLTPSEPLDPVRPRAGTADGIRRRAPHHHA